MRIVLYGHFGTGNLGNDSTLAAMLSHLRARTAQAEVTVACSGPKVIAARHSVAAVPLCVRAVERWPSWVPRLLRRALDRTGKEVATLWRAAGLLGPGARLMIVGTGAVDDMAVHPSGAPLDLLRWCALAKLRRADVEFVSVGVGPIAHPTSRVMMLAALRLARYRSYREPAALDYLHRVGFDTSGDPVFPDLVLSLPVADLPPASTGPDCPLRVGIGLISYYGWRHDRLRGEGIYQRYLAGLRQFVEWLLAEGHTVRLLTGDLIDRRTADDLRARVASGDGRLVAEQMESVDALFAQIGKTDIVVASRFHNVVCAMLAGRPVLSVGYHAKNDDVLAAAGLGAYCQRIDSLDVDRLKTQFASLVGERESAAARVRAYCAQARADLDRQYEILFPVPAAAGARVA